MTVDELMFEEQYVALANHVRALESALRTYRTHPADHTWCRRGVNPHVREGHGREYDNRCMICVRADNALER